MLGWKCNLIVPLRFFNSIFMEEGKQEKSRLADFSKMRTSIARGPGPPTLPPSSPNAFEHRGGRGVQKRGAPNSCQPSPLIAPFLSTVNFCVSCTAQNLPRCASGGGVRGKEINPALTLGEEEEEGKEGRRRRITLGPFLRSHPERAGPARPALWRPSPERRRASRGAAHTPAGAPRGGETRASEPGERGHSPQLAEPSSRTTRGNISAAAAGSPPAPPQVSRAAAAAVTGRIGRHRRHGQDRTPPSVTSRTRRPGCLAARTRAPATPRPLPPLLPPREPRTRTRPRPAAGTVDATPSCLAGSSLRSSPRRRGLDPSPTQWHAPDAPVTSRHPPPPAPSPAVCVPARLRRLRAERVCERSPGTSLHPPCPRIPPAPHTVPGPVASVRRRSPAFTPTLTRRERHPVLLPPTWAPRPARAPRALSPPRVRRPPARRPCRSRAPTSGRAP